MDFGSILALAIGLAMDATAAAAVQGARLPRLMLRHGASVALFFGGFQALMPLLGWVVGAQLGPWVEAWDHWLAFVLLGAIGGKMLWDARASGDEHHDHAAPAIATLELRTLALLAVATSIDALAVGVTLPMLGAPLLLSIVTIGVTTAVTSVVGLMVGHRFGARLGNKLDVAGGLVLIGLGTKILLEHTL